MRAMGVTHALASVSFAEPCQMLGLRAANLVTVKLLNEGLAAPPMCVIRQSIWIDLDGLHLAPGD